MHTLIFTAKWIFGYFFHSNLIIHLRNTPRMLFTILLPPTWKTTHIVILVDVPSHVNSDKKRGDKNSKIPQQSWKGTSNNILYLCHSHYIIQCTIIRHVFQEQSKKLKKSKTSNLNDISNTWLQLVFGMHTHRHTNTHHKQ